MIDKPIPEETLDTIAEAFSLTAETYDRFAEDHPHLTRIRQKVYDHLMRHIPSRSHILELNSGSGVDAVYLARQGYRIHATDIAEGMLGRLDDKIVALGIAEQVTTQVCSFTDLEEIEGGLFDVVFSDLGGLNCSPDLSLIAEKLPLVLRPDGIVTWVVMPKICLWELALVFTGQIRLAFRRLRRGGTIAHLEGLYFPVYYYSPRQVIKTFGSDYEVLAIEGLSVITPTTESKNFIRRYPRLYRILAYLDDRLSHTPLWRGWGDFFIVTMRYTP